jgi:hypothetical protein
MAGNSHDGKVEEFFFFFKKKIAFILAIKLGNKITTS